MVRRFTIAFTLAALLGGCGGGDDGSSRSAPAAESQAGASATPAASQAPVLVSFIQQRSGALIDKITVRTDGAGVFDRPSGGVGRVLREIELEPAAVDALRSELKHVPRRIARGRGTLAPNGATYIMRFRGRTVVARQGREPPRLRRPIRLLAGMLVGDHVRKIVGEQLGGVAGSTHVADIGKETKAREVVFFQRQGAAGATLDTISVRTDGTATHDMRYGGAGGRFREYVLRAGELPRIRRALAKLPRGSSITRGSPPPGGAQYLLRYRGRTLTGRAGGIARAARPAVRLLDGLIDGIGVARVMRTNQTHSR